MRSLTYSGFNVPPGLDVSGVLCTESHSAVFLPSLLPPPLVRSFPLSPGLSFWLPAHVLKEWTLTSSIPGHSVGTVALITVVFVSQRGSEEEWGSSFRLSFLFDTLFLSYKSW